MDKTGDEQQRDFVARKHLYHELSKPQHHSFLRRNLRDALDGHEQKSPKGILRTNDECSVLFGICTKTMWEEAIRGAKPVLTITSLHLRRAHDSRRPEVRTRSEEQDGDPDWLPRADESRLWCQISVAITNPRPEGHTRKPPVVLAETGVIRSRPGKTFEIDLRHPIEVEADCLLSHAPSYTGEGPWRKTFLKDYGLEIAIHCRNSADTADFLSQIEGRPREDYLIAPGNEGIIRAVWNQLPDLPRPGSLLTLKRPRGHRSLELPYGAEVHMRWNKSVSALAICNRATRHVRQLPTPVSEDLDPPRIEYRFRSTSYQTRTSTVADLKCLFCEHRGEHSSFERLHLHYLTHHDHFVFVVEDDPSDRDCRIIWISNREDRRGADVEEWEWQAPDRAFDIEAHLNGEIMWEVRETRTKGKSKAPARHAKIRSQADSPARKMPLPPARPKRKLAPEEVQDLPAKRVKRHRVPRVPGITFYRNTSRQAVEPGTVISDSDEDIDEVWQMQSQRQRLVDLGEEGTSLDFHQLFHRHLNEERSMSDRFTRESVIRFARKFKSKLNQPGWTEKLREKLQLMQTRRVIGEDVVEYCMKMVASAGATKPAEVHVMGQTPEPEEPNMPETNNDVFQDSPPTARMANFRRNAIATSGEKEGDATTAPLSSTDRRNAISTPSRNERLSSEATATPQGKTFGRREILCVRPGVGSSRDFPDKTSVSTPIKRMIDDDWKKVRRDDIQPQYLDWKYFVHVLDNALVYNRHADNIWCASVRAVVTDEKDWFKALTEARDRTTGPIRFELITRHELDKKFEEGADEVAQVKMPSFVPINQKSKGKENERPAPSIEAQQEEPPAPSIRAQKRDLCVCGVRVESQRKTIPCGNPSCNRAFHMACVKLERRTIDWKCEDCR